MQSWFLNEFSVERTTKYAFLTISVQWIVNFKLDCIVTPISLTELTFSINPALSMYIDEYKIKFTVAK